MILGILAFWTIIQNSKFSELRGFALIAPVVILVISLVVLVLELRQDRHPTGAAKKRRWQSALIVLAIAIFASLLVRTFVLQIYRVENDAVAPEIPVGSHVFVFKLQRTFVAGDIIVYRGFTNMLGRVVQDGPRDGLLLIERRGEQPQAVAMSDVIGKVVFNTRNASQKPVPQQENGFGTIMERTLLPAESSMGSCALSLADGRFIDVPPEFSGWDKKKREEWVKGTNANIVCEFRDGHWELLVSNIDTTAELPTQAPEAWSMTAEQFKRNHCQPPEILQHARGLQLHYNLENWRIPITIAFKSEYAAGVLQVVETTENPPVR